MKSSASTPSLTVLPADDLDGISLRQALRDFEVANARVLDLSHRLVRSEEKCCQLANEVEHLRLALAHKSASSSDRYIRGVRRQLRAIRGIAGKVFAKVHAS